MEWPRGFRGAGSCTRASTGIRGLSRAAGAGGRARAARGWRSPTTSPREERARSGCGPHPAEHHPSRGSRKLPGDVLAVASSAPPVGSRTRGAGPRAAGWTSGPERIRPPGPGGGRLRASAQARRGAGDRRQGGHRGDQGSPASRSSAASSHSTQRCPAADGARGRARRDRLRDGYRRGAASRSSGTSACSTASELARALGARPAAHRAALRRLRVAARGARIHGQGGEAGGQGDRARVEARSGSPLSRCHPSPRRSRGTSR